MYETIIAKYKNLRLNSQTSGIVDFAPVSSADIVNVVIVTGSRKVKYTRCFAASFSHKNWLTGRTVVGITRVRSHQTVVNDEPVLLLQRKNSLS